LLRLVVAERVVAQAVAQAVVQALVQALVLVAVVRALAVAAQLAQAAETPPIRSEVGRVHPAHPVRAMKLHHVRTVRPELDDRI